MENSTQLMKHKPIECIWESFSIMLPIITNNFQENKFLCLGLELYEQYKNTN